jgi:DNA polymerase
LNLIGLQRPQVYVLNVVKCRPPENRDPEPTEIAACAGFLERQLALLQPVIIAPLGRHALRAFAPEAKISETHGAPFQGETRQTPAGTTLFPLYHPAAALHNGALRPTLERDMGALARALPAARSTWRVARGGAGEASLSEIEAAAERDQLRLFESEAQ